MRGREVFRGLRPALTAVLTGVLLITPMFRASAQERVIEILADNDNKFKVPGQKKPIITLKAGERIRLRVIARKSTEWDKDGSVHSFSIAALHDQGWDLLLKEGTQEFVMTAPTEPGEYKVECTVKCGVGHNNMRMKLIVTP